MHARPATTKTRPKTKKNEKKHTSRPYFVQTNETGKQGGCLRRDSILWGLTAGGVAEFARAVGDTAVCGFPLSEKQKDKSSLLCEPHRRRFPTPSPISTSSSKAARTTIAVLLLLQRTNFSNPASNKVRHTTREKSVGSHTMQQVTVKHSPPKFNIPTSTRAPTTNTNTDKGIVHIYDTLTFPEKTGNQKRTLHEISFNQTPQSRKKNKWSGKPYIIPRLSSANEHDQPRKARPALELNFGSLLWWGEAMKLSNEYQGFISPLGCHKKVAAPSSIQLLLWFSETTVDCTLVSEIHRPSTALKGKSGHGNDSKQANIAGKQDTGLGNKKHFTLWHRLTVFKLNGRDPLLGSKPWHELLTSARCTRDFFSTLKNCIKKRRAREKPHTRQKYTEGASWYWAIWAARVVATSTPKDSATIGGLPPMAPIHNNITSFLGQLS